MNFITGQFSKVNLLDRLTDAGSERQQGCVPLDDPDQDQ